MSPHLKACERKALKLPVEERAALAEHLIASLDEMETKEIEKLWLEEAERRYRAYKNGDIPAKSAENVMREARARIR